MANFKQVNYKPWPWLAEVIRRVKVVGLVTIIKLIFAGNEEPGTIAVYSLPLLGTEMKPEFQTLYTDNIPRDNRSCSQMYIDRDAFAIGPETLM